MADELYNVIFQGKTLADADLQQVKEQLARLFKVDEEKVSKMFSGKAVVIKKSTDRATAQKYSMAMKKAGAVAQICTLDGKVVDFSKPEQKEEPTPQAAAEPQSVPSDALTLAAVGEQIMPPQDVVEASFNTEGMTMAPVGSDVADLEPAPPAFEADLSNLEMAEAGERILDPNTPPSETRGTKYIPKGNI